MRDPRGTPGSRLAAWSLYDVATSVYHGLIPTLLFPLAFKTMVAAGDPRAERWWGLTVAAAHLAAGLLMPLVGALGDQGRLRHRLLAVTTVLCAGATVSLVVIAPGGVLAAATLFAVGQVAYLASMSLYDAYLVDLAPRAGAGRASGYGWAVGYLGGVAGVLLCMPLVPAGFPVCFGLAGALVIVLALPALRAFRAWDGERPATPPSIGQAYRRLGRTLREWRRHRQVFRSLAAIYCINDVVVTVILFASMYFNRVFRLDLAGLLKLSLLCQALAIPATALAGVAGDRWGLRRVLGLTLPVWASLVALLAFGRGGWVPWAVVAALGLVTGSTQALCRALFASLIPRAQAAEFMGFNAVALRVSTALGPILCGTIATATGSPRLGMLSLLPFLLAGAVLLVDRREA